MVEILAVLGARFAFDLLRLVSCILSSEIAV